MPRLLQFVSLRSAIEIGCRCDAWLTALLERGIDCIGLGRAEDAEAARIPGHLFVAADPSGPPVLDRQFDLCLSIGTAGRLTADRLPGLLDHATRLAPVVVFSAPIPLEGGDFNLTGYWPPFWVEQFSRRGYQPIDCLRDAVWNDPIIDAGTAQNLFLFARTADLPRYPALAAAAAAKALTEDRLSVVHPRVYTDTVSALLDRLKAEQEKTPPAPARPPWDGSEDMRRERRSAVEGLLRCAPDALENLGATPLAAAYARVIASSLLLEPLNVEEECLLDTLRRTIADAPPERPAIQAHLAALLYRPAFALPRLPAPDRLPGWAIEPVIHQALRAPVVFRDDDELDAYLAFAQGWVAEFDDRIAREGGIGAWRMAAKACALSANFLPLYHSTDSLRPVYEARGRILSRVLRDHGHALDHEFGPRRDGKLRLGVLAANFEARTETFTTLPAFRHLDRDRFEVVLLGLGSSGSATEMVCRAHADAFVALPSDIAAAAASIRELDLDILLFGTNITAVTNQIALLAAYRLARVQGTGFSSPITTGMPHMDFYLSGTLSEQTDLTASHYSERLVRLPGTGFCFDYSQSPAPSAPMPTRRTLGIPEDAVVFASGANYFKIGPRLRDCWARILAVVPNSFLLLYPFGPAWSAAYPEREFVRWFEEGLVAAGVHERCRFATGLPSRADVQNLLRIADVYLDSFPYSGANSNVDPLELALPVVTLDGATLRMRQGPAMLLDLGLSDLVAADDREYIAIAARLGADPAYRRTIGARTRTAVAKGPGFLDVAAYGRLMGAALEEILAAALGTRDAA